MNTLSSHLKHLWYLEQPQWILWTPVLLGIGILVYFAQMHEPAHWLDILLTLALFSLSYFLRRHSGFCLLFLSIALIVAGFSLAHLRTWVLATPMLQEPINRVRLIGTVREIVPLNRGDRLIVEALHFPFQLEHMKLPEAARLTVRTSHPFLAPGDRIAFTAALTPPPIPVLPRGYDFARRAYFEKIGAVGYTLSPIDYIGPSPSSLKEILLHPLLTFRTRLMDTIHTSMPEHTGAIAIALMLGAQTAISPSILEAMRDSGLAHMLSVSGMHLSWVAALFYGTCRLIFAAIPWITLRFPIKQWSAAIALIATWFYLLISGMQIAAQRSCVMTTLVLLAILCNRTPTPMRSIAAAATVLLLCEPESMIDPSFQMSFAAVTGLLASYPLFMRLTGEADLETPSILKLITRHILAALFSSSVAGSATTPFALYHFHQHANYSILANMLALPLSSFWIMPWAVVAFFLYPFGLVTLALTCLDVGISGLLSVAAWVAALPYATVRIPAFSLLSMLVITTGFLWLCLWQSSWRCFGLIVMLAGVLLAFITPRPDVLISDRFPLFAVRGEKDQLCFYPTRRGKFAKEQWLRANGQAEVKTLLPDGLTSFCATRCTETGCLYQKAPYQIGFVFDAAQFAYYCKNADMIVNFSETSQTCEGKKVLQKEAFLSQGTHAITRTSSGFLVRTARSVTSTRPWEKR